MTDRRRRCVLAIAAAAVVLLGAAAWLPWPTWLLYNPSDSAPRGWYLQRPARELRPGMPVFARLPPEAARLAHARGYLPQHLPILKRIGAGGGQHVCVGDGLVRIDGRAVTVLRTRDGRSRSLHAWPGCRTLAADEVFLFASTSPASYDSRYFGPVRREAILGEAVPLWTW